MFHSPFSIGEGPYEYEINYGRISEFLVHDKDEPPESTKIYPYMRTSTDCVAHLLELCQDIKCNPGRLTRLLIYIAKSNLVHIIGRPNPICIVDCYNILKVIRKCSLGKNGTSYITDSYELAGLLRDCRDEVTGRWSAFTQHTISEVMDQLSGKDDFRGKCNEAIGQLTSQSLTPFSLQTHRLVTCARPTVTADAAAGILRIHDD